MLRGRLPYSLSAAAALTFACGLSVTIVLFAAISQLEYDKMSLSLQQRAGARVAAIEQGLDDAVEVLTTTNQLFSAVVPVTRQQFHDFTTPLLQRHPLSRPSTTTAACRMRSAPRSKPNCAPSCPATP